MESKIKEIGAYFYGFTELARLLHGNNDLYDSISGAYGILSLAARRGNTIFIFGNGGSAADSQHFAAELVGRFRKNRRAIGAIALTTDTSIVTAQSNDIGFETIFSRQLEALCRLGDVVIGITTSDVGEGGHSKNIENGFLAARKKNARTIGLFGERTKNLLSLADVSIIVPHTDTARVQEAHRPIIHVLCDLIERDIN